MAEDLREKLRNESQGSDFLVSMLWAAMTSYRHDTVLRPFPPKYQNGEHKNVEKLVSGQKRIYVHAGTLGGSK